MESSAPPLENPKSRKTSSSSKSTKPSRHATRHAGPHNAAKNLDHAAHGTPANGRRQKRVRKACERCRIKKTRCDGVFPCKRCKDGNLICPADVRKKMVYKKPPPGYAEALEHAQFALVATVHKLYSMVRNQQRWDLGEPELNDGGRPMIHNIAQKLGYIRPNSDIDLPVPSVFPEDEPGLTKLARQLEKQQKERNGIKAMEAKIDSASYEESEHASSSKIDDSEFGTDYRKSVFGSHNNPKPMSPQSFSTGYTEFEIEPFASPVQQAPDVFQQNQASSMRTDQHWDMPTQTASSMYLAQNFFHHSGDNDMEIINQGVIEPEFGNIKPQVVECSSEAAMVIGDWTTYGVCDSEPM